MPQRIDIPVSADTSGAEAALKKVDQATAGLNQRMEQTAKATEGAAKQVEALERAARKLQSVQLALKQTLGRPVGEGDASLFLDNFEAMRRKSPSLRRFNDFDSWWTGHTTAYGSPGRAAQHRRVVMSTALQGTSYADQYGAPDAPDGGGGGGGAGGSGGAGAMAAGAGIGALAKSALGFGAVGLGLAGIGSVVSSLQKSVDLARTEAITTSQSRRRLGLGVGSFYDLQNETRGASTDLMTDFVGAAQLGGQFLRGAGNMRSEKGLGGMLSNAGKFAQAFGLDSSESVGFFSDMKRTGVGGDEEGQRRLAQEIADAIDRSGFRADAGEMLRSLQSYNDTIARFALQRPNVSGYASAMAGMIDPNISGADPQNVNAILSGMDQSLRGGGSAGEAGMNFIYRALARPGMNPFYTHAMMQGGLEASIHSTFYDPNSVLYGHYHGKDDTTTNGQKLRAALTSQYGLNLKNDDDFAKGMAISARTFGMTDAGAALWLSHPEKKLNPKDPRYFNLNEHDLGQQSLLALNGINKSLTEVGGAGLLQSVNVIGDTLNEIADKLIPDRQAIRSNKQYALNDIARGNPGLADYAKTPADLERGGAFLHRALYQQASVVGKGGTFDIGSFVRNIPDPNLRSALTAGLMREHNWIGMLNDSDREVGLAAGTGVRQALKESGMDPGSRSGKGAMGLMQFMPDTVRRLTPKFIAKYHHAPNPWDPEDSIRLRTLLMAEDMGLAHGDPTLAMRYYQGGTDRSKWGVENLAYAGGIVAGTPMPGGGAPQPGTPASMNHYVQGHVVVTTPTGQVVGTAPLKPMGPPQAAGTN